MILTDNFSVSLTDNDLIHLQKISRDPKILYHYFQNKSLIENGLVCYDFEHTRLTKLGKRVLERYKDYSFLKNIKINNSQHPFTYISS
jgi:hypothetical protein